VGGETGGRRLSGRPGHRWDNPITIDIEEKECCVEIN
jgi:hypothetical protein